MCKRSFANGSNRPRSGAPRLHPLEHRLVLPTHQAPIVAGGALRSQCAARTGRRPVLVDHQAVHLARESVDRILAGRFRGSSRNRGLGAQPHRTGFPAGARRATAWSKGLPASAAAAPGRCAVRSGRPTGLRLPRGHVRMARHGCRSETGRGASEATGPQRFRDPAPNFRCGSFSGVEGLLSGRGFRAVAVLRHRRQSLSWLGRLSGGAYCASMPRYRISPTSVN